MARTVRSPSADVADDDPHPTGRSLRPSRQGAGAGPFSVRSGWCSWPTLSSRLSPARRVPPGVATAWRDRDVLRGTSWSRRTSSASAAASSGASSRPCSSLATALLPVTHRRDFAVRLRRRDCDHGAGHPTGVRRGRRVAGARAPALQLLDDPRRRKRRRHRPADRTAPQRRSSGWSASSGATPRWPRPESSSRSWPSTRSGPASPATCTTCSGTASPSSRSSRSWPGGCWRPPRPRRGRARRHRAAGPRGARGRAGRPSAGYREVTPRRRDRPGPGRAGGRRDRRHAAERGRRRSRRAAGAVRLGGARGGHERRAAQRRANAAASRCRPARSRSPTTVGDRPTSVDGSGLAGLRERRGRGRWPAGRGPVGGVRRRRCRRAAGLAASRGGGAVMIRLLLADDQALVRGALAALLSLETDLDGGRRGRPRRRGRADRARARPDVAAARRRDARAGRHRRRRPPCAARCPPAGS